MDSTTRSRQRSKEPSTVSKCFTLSSLSYKKGKTARSADGSGHHDFCTLPVSVTNFSDIFDCILKRCRRYADLTAVTIAVAQ